MTTAKILSELFAISGMNQKEFIQRSGISESQFYKIMASAKSESEKFDCLFSTIRQWVNTSAEGIDDLSGDWLTLVMKLYLGDAVVDRLAPKQIAEPAWHEKLLDSFVPDSIKLLFRK